MTPDELVFYFDFASPYAYVAFDRVMAIGAEAGLPVVARPVMVWAILKAQGIPPPLDPPARRAYMLADMARSAAFHGLPWRQPEWLPISAHLASRMWLGFAADEDRLPLSLTRALYDARFARGLDICDPTTLQALALEAGHDPVRASAHMKSDAAHAALAANIDAAVACGVPGIPCIRAGEELFFGADRLPQLRWRLGLPPFATPQLASPRVC